MWGILTIKIENNLFSQIIYKQTCHPLCKNEDLKIIHGWADVVA